MVDKRYYKGMVHRKHEGNHMQDRATEGLHRDAKGLDALPGVEIARALHTGQMDALSVVGSAVADIADGAELMASALQNGRSIIYAAAGSSGLMAAADALEISGTFGVPTDQIQILMAGGLPTDSSMPGATEDDTVEAEAAARAIQAGDVVIAVSASGSTPYAVTIARIARETGAKTICIANNPDTPIFDHASVAICLSTPAEVIAGSTRMGAGTAQKVALNMMSSIMGVRLGHVHDGMMVNVCADNDKLRQRAVSMIVRIAAVPESVAREHLLAASGEVKPAILTAAGVDSLARARSLLSETNGQLRAALALL